MRNHFVIALLQTEERGKQNRDPRDVEAHNGFIRALRSAVKRTLEVIVPKTGTDKKTSERVSIGSFEGFKD